MESQLTPLERLPKILLIGRCIVFDADGKALFIRRALTDRWDPGLFEFPGGKLRIGQTVDYGIKDEVRQETDLHVVVTETKLSASRYLTEGPYRGHTYIGLTGIGRIVSGALNLSVSIWKQNGYFR